MNAEVDKPHVVLRRSRATGRHQSMGIHPSKRDAQQAMRDLRDRDQYKVYTYSVSPIS